MAHTQRAKADDAMWSVLYRDDAQSDWRVDTHAVTRQAACDRVDAMLCSGIKLSQMQLHEVSKVSPSSAQAELDAVAAEIRTTRFGCGPAGKNTPLSEQVRSMKGDLLWAEERHQILYIALANARDFIQADREAYLNSVSIAGDIATVTEWDRPTLERFDAALAAIEEAFA